MHKTAEALTAKPWEAVFLAARQKRPGGFGGGSLMKGERWQTSRDAEMVDKHLQTANIGYLTGPKTELAVIDVDDPDRFQELVSLLGKPGKPWVRTGSGKEHYYLTWESGLPARLRFGKEVIGEIQRGSENENGSSLQQVVAPGSIHPDTGKHYTWQVDPVSEPLRPLPDVWRAYLQGRFESPNGHRRQPDIDQLRVRARQQPGARERSAGIKFQCRACRDEGHDKHEDNAILFNDGRWGCAIGGRAHWEVIAQELGVELRCEASQTLPTTSVNLREQHLTDAGNAQRFAALHGDNVRYCFPFKNWFVWDERRFATDDRGDIVELAKKVPLAMLSQAHLINEKDLRKKFTNFVFRSEDNRRLKAMLSLGQSALAVVPSEFDSDDWLLNCQNGVLDLSRAELLLHDRRYLMTRLAMAEYHPATECPVWKHFLDDVTGGDRELERFLQMATGYTLTGDTSEEKLFFCYGPTNTGKSTFLEAVGRMLGDYSRTAEFETFLESDFKGGGRPRGDIARLAGSRMVRVSEHDKGNSRLAHGIIKKATGGEAITASFKFRDEFEFVPKFKLWFGANDAPSVRDDDAAMWRRVLRVPFAHEIPAAKRDKQVKATLTSSPQSRAAILAWAVRGLSEWLIAGELPVPEAVAASTKEYRDENDPLRDFLTDCCVLDPQEWTPTQSLRRAYDDWCRDEGIRYPLTPKGFSERLKARGCLPRKRQHKRGWQGIKLAGTDGTDRA